jgi:nucleotide-binding universal stress UspA family protein
VYRATSVYDSKGSAGMYQRVLIPLDGSKLAEEILPLAERVSSGFTIPLHLLTVIQRNSVAATRAAGLDANQKAAEKAQDYLGMILERVGRGVGTEHVKMAVKIGEVADTIVQEAESVPKTLIALSSHGRSGLTRMVLGSVADKVLHGTRAPVFIYSPREDVPVRQAEDFNTIMVPLDGSELAEQALPYAAALANALQLKVILVRVTSTLADLASDGFYEVTQVLIDELEKEAIDYLDRKVSTLRQEGLKDVDRRHLTGSAARKIIDSARETPRSFIAMCSHGRSGVQRWALGSVADQVVSQVAVPVLVVRAAS